MERLFFYVDRPTEEQRKEAARLGAKLRDALAVRSPPYKPCDEAYGDVPEPYLGYKMDVEPMYQKKAKKKVSKKKTTRKKAK